VLTTCELNKSQLATAYAVLDVITVLFLGIAIAWLRRFEDMEIKALDRNTVGPADYTVKIRRVPPDVTERELASHLEAVLKPRVRAGGLHKIASVALGYNNEQQIVAFRERGALLRKLFTCVSGLRYVMTTEGREAAQKSRRFARLMQQRSEVRRSRTDASWRVRIASLLHTTTMSPCRRARAPSCS
jgi:hypothetical protein